MLPYRKFWTNFRPLGTPTRISRSLSWSMSSRCQGPQKSCRFAQPAPCYHWNPSPQYDLEELDDCSQHTHITEFAPAPASDVAAKVASKRYLTSVSVIVVIFHAILMNRVGCPSSRVVWEDQGRSQLPGGVFIRDVEVRGPW